MSTQQDATRLWSVLSVIVFLTLCAVASLLYNSQSSVLLLFSYLLSFCLAHFVFRLLKNNEYYLNEIVDFRKNNDLLKKKIYELELKYCPTVEHLKDAIWGSGVD